MPPLSEPTLIDAVKERFRSFKITLPTAGSTAPLNVGQFLLQDRPAAPAKLTMRGGAPPPPKSTAIPLSVPPALIRAASNDKVDVDIQTQVNTELSTYITTMCRAIVGAHDNWRQTAYLQGVQVMAGTAIGGNINGPLLSVNMKMTGPQQGLWGNAGAYTRAIADGLASCWRDWEQSVRVPSLQWYPSMVAFPGPTAPPVPNVPTPMSTLAWSPTALAPDTLKTTMSSKLAQPGPYSDELFTSIASGFSTAVALWFPVQPVTMVLGRGPIPAFAPPYVPVGPVVGGNIIEAGPHFNR